MAINRFLWLAALGTSVLAAVPAVSQDVQPKEEGKEQAIDVGKVPTEALEQAKKTLNGKVTKAYLVEMEGQQAYELEGTDAQGAEMAVYVTSDGNSEDRKGRGRRGRQEGVRQAGRPLSSQTWRISRADGTRAGKRPRQ
jgi:hypothetical protein